MGWREGGGLFNAEKHNPNSKRIVLMACSCVMLSLLSQHTKPPYGWKKDLEISADKFMQKKVTTWRPLMQTPNPFMAVIHSKGAQSINQPSTNPLNPHPKNPKHLTPHSTHLGDWPPLLPGRGLVDISERLVLMDTKEGGVASHLVTSLHTARAVPGCRIEN